MNHEVYGENEITYRFNKIRMLSHDKCLNQWRNGVLGNAQFPNTQ